MFDELRERFPNLEKNLPSPEILKPPVELEYLKKNCEGDELLESLYADMVRYLQRYTETVCEYNEILNQDLTDCALMMAKVMRGYLFLTAIHHIPI